MKIKNYLIFYKKFITILLFLLIFKFNVWSGVEQSRTTENENNQNINPVKFYEYFIANIKNKQWNKVLISMGLRFNEFMKIIFKRYNNVEQMKDFLIKHEIKEPVKYNFADINEFTDYFFENSAKYKRLFEDIEKGVFKVIIDFYNKSNEISYEPITKQYYKLLDPKSIRKLKFILTNFRVVYIRRDIRGWYFDTGFN